MWAEIFATDMATFVVAFGLGALSRVWGKPAKRKAIVVGCTRCPYAQPPRTSPPPAPTEEEAQAINAAHGLTCPTEEHAVLDCTNKARQRIALGLPGHQR
jgi:hypothetical protein